MAEGIVQVTEGSGKKLHTWQRTVGANSVEDEFTIPGEYPLPSYFCFVVVATNTANDHLMQIMAGTSTYVRIRRIVIEQRTNATAATNPLITVLRLTTAGTGGTAITPRPHDPADAAASFTAMSLPTSKGTEGVTLFAKKLLLRQAILTTGAQSDDRWEWVQHPGAKPIICGTGTANGIALKTAAGFGAAGDVTIMVECVETTFAG